MAKMNISDETRGNIVGAPLAFGSARRTKQGWKNLAIKAASGPNAFYEGVTKKSYYKKDNKFFGHSKVNKQNIVENPPQQVKQFSKDGFYSNVVNKSGKS